MTSDPNQAATEQWIETTDGFERVEAVVTQTRDPTSAAEIAEQAHVSESTARKHLERLVDLGPATALTEGRTTRYQRNEDHYLMERVQELQRTQTRDDLLQGIEDLHAEIRAYGEKYTVDSPEELALEIDSTEGSADPWGDVTAWQTARRNLAIAQAALAFKRARDLAEA